MLRLWSHFSRQFVGSVGRWQLQSPLSHQGTGRKGAWKIDGQAINGISEFSGKFSRNGENMFSMFKTFFQQNMYQDQPKYSGRMNPTCQVRCVRFYQSCSALPPHSLPHFPPHSLLRPPLPAHCNLNCKLPMLDLHRKIQGRTIVRR